MRVTGSSCKDFTYIVSVGTCRGHDSTAPRQAWLILPGSNICRPFRSISDSNRHPRPWFAVSGHPFELFLSIAWTEIVETELFAQTYKSYGLATARYPYQ